MRDDIPENVKEKLAARVGFQCSNPDCRASTSGPHLDPAQSVNVGVAAHISAASAGGPRYNPALSREDRRSIDNAIWLCQICAKMIDSDLVRFTPAVLHKWKRQAEAEAQLRLGKAQSTLGRVRHRFAEEEIEILVAAAGRGEVLIMSAEQLGKWISASASDFVNPADPEVAARYLDAFDSLCVSGLIRHDEGNLYMLTASGFRIARELRARPAPREGVAKVTGSEFVKFEPPLNYTPRVRATRQVWQGGARVCDLEITEVSAEGFRAAIRNKIRAEIEMPGWATCTFNWIAEPPPDT